MITITLNLKTKTFKGVYITAYYKQTEDIIPVSINYIYMYFFSMRKLLPLCVNVVYQNMYIHVVTLGALLLTT